MSIDPVRESASLPDEGGIPALARGPRFTGIGSLPAAIGLGADDRHFSAAEFQSRGVGLSPGLPYLAEAPSRGIGADMIGRTLALASAVAGEFAASMSTSGWRRSAPGRDMEAAQAFLRADIDGFCQAVSGFTGVAKVQMAGPFTVAALLEGANGERMIADRSFVQDLSEVIAEAASGLVDVVVRQTSVADASHVIVQVDEPMLPQVIAGSVPTASGLHRYPPIHAADAAAIVQRLTERIASPTWVHCCAADVPLALLRSINVQGVSVDARFIDDGDLDHIGDVVDSRLDLVLGVIHPSQWNLPRRQLADVAVTTAERLRVRLGFAEPVWWERLVLTPSCGLAGASADQAHAVMAALDAACASLAGGTIGSIES